MFLERIKWNLTASFFWLQLEPHNIKLSFDFPKSSWPFRNPISEEDDMVFFFFGKEGAPLAGIVKHWKQINLSFSLCWLLEGHQIWYFPILISHSLIKFKSFFFFFWQTLFWEVNFLLTKCILLNLNSQFRVLSEFILSLMNVILMRKTVIAMFWGASFGNSMQTSMCQIVPTWNVSSSCSWTFKPEWQLMTLKTWNGWLLMYFCSNCIYFILFRFTLSKAVKPLRRGGGGY